MEKQFKKKITWTIKDLNYLKREALYSDQFVVGGCKWLLCAIPIIIYIFKRLHLVIVLEVADYESLPLGWRCLLKEWFDETNSRSYYQFMLPLNEIKAKDSGFLVNQELKIVAEVEVLQVIGKLDVPVETSTTMETIDVNGFRLFPSQVKFVSHIFEKHAEIASELRPKNPNLRTAYMSFLLSLIETLRQLPNKLSKTDLAEAYAALGFMTNAGFKLDWLVKKL